MFDKNKITQGLIQFIEKDGNYRTMQQFYLKFSELLGELTVSTTMG